MYLIISPKCKYCDQVIEIVKGQNDQKIKIYDSNKSKQGKDFCGYRLKNPDEIEISTSPYVIITCCFPTQILRDLNKKFAPGITEKKLGYLKTLKPGSRDYKLALADFGLKTSFDAQVNSDQMSGEPLTVETADTYASIYYPNYQGQLTADSKKGGMYLDVEEKKLVLVDGETGEITTFKALQLQ